MRKAIVDNSTGLVLNVIVLPDFWTGTNEKDWKTPKGTILVDAEAYGSVGDFWNGTKFIAPNPPIQAKTKDKKRRGV